MNKRTIIITLLILVSMCCSSIPVAAQETIPKIIKKALEKYEKEGADQLIPNLLKGSPLEGDKQALSQVNVVRQIETFYGKYLNYEPLKVVNLTKSTQLVYYVMNYENGPLFASATVYKNKEKEIIVNFNYHTEFQQIIPPSFIEN